MADPGPPRRRTRRPSVGDEVGVKERRKLRARRGRERSVWFGLGTFGMIGWSVAVPTLLGLALGVWIDSRFPSGVSWTLMLLLGGIILGCTNAWYWLNSEQRLIEAEEARNGDELPAGGDALARGDALTGVPKVPEPPAGGPRPADAQGDPRDAD